MIPSKHDGPITMDMLLDILDQMQDEPPTGEDVLVFLLDFFRYLEQEDIRVSIASEGRSANSRYSQLAWHLTRLACWDPEQPSFRLYEQLLELVRYILRPESRSDLEVQQRLEKVRELLTLLQFYWECRPQDFEQALGQYLSDAVCQIRAAIWEHEPPRETRKAMETMKRRLEHTEKQLLTEKERANRLQEQLDLAMEELRKKT